MELLFAGAPNSADIKQEILQNSLDRYDDLISQGKSPEAAYTLAISGIGDITGLLNADAPAQPIAPVPPTEAPKRAAPLWKKCLRAAAVFLYIVSAIPLFVLSEIGMEVIGLCGTLAIAAVATALLIIAGSTSSIKAQVQPVTGTSVSPRQELQKAVSSAIWITGLILYFLISFSTRAWHITWLIFPMIGTVQGLARGIIDLKEAGKYEN